MVRCRLVIERLEESAYWTGRNPSLFCSIPVFQIFTSQAEDRRLLFEENKCHTRRDFRTLMFGVLTQSICLPSRLFYNESHQLISSVLTHRAFLCLVLKHSLVAKEHPMFQKSLQHKRERDSKYMHRKEEILEIQSISGIALYFHFFLICLQQINHALPL